MKGMKIQVAFMSKKLAPLQVRTWDTLDKEAFAKVVATFQPLSLTAHTVVASKASKFHVAFGMSNISILALSTNVEAMMHGLIFALIFRFVGLCT